jgi:membrane-associated phospholipid phosphatase
VTGVAGGARRAVIDLLWGPGSIVAVQHAFGPGWLWFFHAISILGQSWIAVVVVAVVAWRCDRPTLLGVLGAIVCGILMSNGLKYLIGLPRPHDPLIVVRETVTSPSFPSGHSVTAATIWGSLGLRRLIPWAVPLLVIPLVMLSRVYLGVHYPGDVLGGAAIGLTVALVWLRVPAWRGRRLHAAGPTSHPEALENDKPALSPRSSTPPTPVTENRAE